MRNHLFLLVFIASFSFQSCQKDEASLIITESEMESFKSYQNVDSELWAYWERFEEEAGKRGFNIDLEASQLVGILVDIDDDHVAGSCTFSSNQPRVIRIDEEIWGDLPILYREFIVFHELGHCILFRDHDESIDQNGNCLSIMRSGLNGCKDIYNLENRDFFIDELFKNF